MNYSIFIYIYCLFPLPKDKETFGIVDYYLLNKYYTLVPKKYFYIYRASKKSQIIIRLTFFGLHDATNLKCKTQITIKLVFEYHIL